ncbi:MAG: hypothetical protein ACO3YZ_03870 [Candidatus Nanopelagicaceae bacterium]
MKRKDIMAALGSQLSAIATPNYNTNIGQSVLYWQDYPSEYGSDALIYRDVAEDTVERGLDHENTLHIEIEGRKFSNTPGATANDMLADIIKAVGVDLTLNSLALKVFLTGNETDVDTEGKTCAQILVKIDVLYRTRTFTTNA